MTIIAKFTWINNSVGIGEQVIYRKLDNGERIATDSLTPTERTHADDFTLVEPRPENITYQVSSKVTLSTGEVIEKISDEFTMEVPPAIPEVESLSVRHFSLDYLVGKNYHYAGLPYHYHFHSPNKQTSYKKDLFVLKVANTVMDTEVEIVLVDGLAVFQFNDVTLSVMDQPIAPATGWDIELSYDGELLYTDTIISRPSALIKTKVQEGRVSGSYGNAGGASILLDAEHKPAYNLYALTGTASGANYGYDYDYEGDGGLVATTDGTLTRTLSIFGPGLTDVLSIESNQKIFDGIKFYSPFSTGYSSPNLFKLTLPELPWWFGSTYLMFSYTYVNEIHFKVHSGITTMGRMFQYNPNGYNGDMGDWDTSNVTDITYFMANNSSMAGFGLGKWDVRKVITMTYFCDSNTYKYTGEDPLSEIKYWDLASLVTAGVAFQNSSRNPDISGWNVPKLTNITSMFKSNKVFNQPIGNWNVPGLVTVTSAFHTATSFNQPLTNWSLSPKCDSLSYMFYRAYAFNQPLEHLDVSEVKTFTYLLEDCSLFDQPLNNWDISNGTTFTAMLKGCTSFNQPLDKWNPMLATVMTNFLNGATGFKQDISTWCVPLILKRPDNFSAYATAADRELYEPGWGTCPLRDMDGEGFSFRAIAGECSVNLTNLTGDIYLNGELQDSPEFTIESNSIITINNLSGTDGVIELTGSITEWFRSPETDPGVMRIGFPNCPSLTKVPDTLPEYITSIVSMFDGCTTFNYDISGWDVSKFTSLYRTFAECRAFNQNINSWDVSKVTSLFQTFINCHLFNQPLDNWDVSNVTTLEQTFYLAKAFNQNINNWNVSKVTTLSYTFAGTSSFNQPLDQWDIGNVTTLGDTFSTSAFNQPINNWDTRKVTSLKGTFYYNEVFNQPLDNWDVSKVTTFGNAFTYASAFDQPLDTWDTSSATTMAFMFQNAKVFNHPLNHFNTAKVANMNAMFQGATLFNQPLDLWDVQSCTNMYSMFLNSSMKHSLSNWCVSLITSRPTSFSAMTANDEPYWGSCPSGYTDDDETQFSIVKESKATIVVDASDSVYLNDNLLDGTTTNGLRTIELTTAYNAIVRVKHGSGREVTTVIDIDCNGILDIIRFATVANGINSIRFRNTESTNLTTIRSIPEKLPVYLTSTAYMFSGQTTFNLTEIAEWDMSNVLDLSYMFEDCKTFNVSLAGWDVSKALSLRGLFKGCSAYNQSFKDWVFGTHLYNLSELLKNCTKYNHSIEEIKAIPSSVDSLLSGATSYNQPIANFNIGEATDLSYMFELCVLLDQPLDNWDVSKVTSFQGMFQNAIYFNQSVAKWRTNTLPVDVDSTPINFNSMFNGCVKYNQPMEYWYIPKGSDAEAMFKGCAAFNQDLSNWYVRYIDEEPTDFGYNSKLIDEHYPVWTTEGYSIKPSFLVNATANTVYKATIKGFAAVDFGDGTRQYCTGETNVSHSYATAGVYRVRQHTLPEQVNEWTSSFPIQTVSLWGDNVWSVLQVGNSELITVPTTAPDAQVYDYLLAHSPKFNQSINTWVIPSTVTSMVGLFEDCTSYNQSIDKLDLSRVVNLSYMFKGCENYNQSIASLNLSSASVLKYMFQGCKSYDQSLKGLNTSNWSDIEGMMYECTSYNSPFADISGSKLSSLEYLFYGCTVFNQDISDWEVVNVSDFDYMLMGCPAFDHDLGNWRVPNAPVGYNEYFSDSLIESKHPVWSSDYTIKRPFIFINEVIDLYDKFDRVGTTYIAAIDLGDGTRVWGASGSFTHEYEEAGEYEVRIHYVALTLDRGTMTDYTKYAKEIKQWASGNAVKSYYLNSKRLVAAPDYGPDPDTWSQLFRGCTIFNQSIDGWSTEGVTDISYMFQSCRAFDQPLNSWDTKEITEMQYLFAGTDVFNQPLDKWDVRKVKYMGYTFSEAKLFNQDLSTWVTESLTKMESMFEYASAFNGALTNFDTSKVTSFNKLFASARKFNQPLNHLNTSKVTNFNNTFNNATAFNQPLSKWDLSSATNMFGMFNNAEAFDQDIGDWVISKITDLGSVFSGAKAFNHYIGDWDVSNVKTYNNTFNGATSYNQPFTNWKTDSATSFYSTFRSAKAFNQPVNHLNFSKVTSTSQMFYSATSFNQPLSGIDTSSLKEISTMFYEATSFNSSVEGLCTALVTSLSAVFGKCTNFNQPLDSWDVSSVTNMVQLFYSCSNFNQPLDNWDVSSVTTFSETFHNASVFDQNIEDWLVNSAKNMYCMFQNAYWFDNDLSYWCVTNVTSQPYNFALNAKMTADKYPVWGTCPARTQDFTVMLDTTAGDTYTIPSTANVSHVVVTGTGRFDASSDGSVTITLPTNVSSTKAVIYPVEGKQLNFIYKAETQLPIKEVTIWPEGGFSSVAIGNPHLVKVPATEPPNTTTLASIFRTAFAFDSDVTGWDVSKMTSLSYMFSGCNIFNQDITGWILTNCTDTSYMFQDCYEFNQPIGGWTMSKVTTIEGMFKNCVEFDQSVNSWTTSKVTTIVSCFEGCASFNQTVNSWNVSAVTQFGSAFRDCVLFNQPLSRWDTAKGLNFNYTFGGCTAFNQNITAWDVSRASNFGYMFFNAVAFNQDLSKWSVKSAIYMTYMFRNATAFSRNLSKWCVTKVTSEPTSFATNSGLKTSQYPVWGTCPNGS